MASSAQWLWPLPGPPSHLLTKPEEVPGVWAHSEKAATPSVALGGSVGGVRVGPVMATCDQAAGVSLLMLVIPQSL